MAEDAALLTTERPHDVREEYEQIYEQPDPRAYFRILHGLNYRLPELAAPVFRNVVSAISEFRGCRPKVQECEWSRSSEVQRC